MRGLNQIVLVGNLGRDPEIRPGKSGIPWGTFSLATTRARRDGEKWVEDVDWHEVKVFGALAEQVGRFCKKGRPVAVTGSVTYEKWSDDEGNKRVSARILADRVDFLGSRPATEHHGADETVDVEAAAEA